MTIFLSNALSVSLSLSHHHQQVKENECRAELSLSLCSVVGSQVWGTNFTTRIFEPVDVGSSEDPCRRRCVCVPRHSFSSDFVTDFGNKKTKKKKQFDVVAVIVSAL